MNIGIITSSMDDQRTGPGNYLLNVCEKLIQTDISNKYTLIHSKQTENNIYSKTKEVLVSSKTPLFEFGIQKQKLDILHFNIIPATRLLNIISAKKIATMHGDLGFVEPGLYGKNRLKWHLRRFWVKKFDHIITVSECTRQNLIKYLRIPAHKITAIYHGVDHNKFKICDTETKSRIRDKFNLNYQFILHVNNYAPKKNHEILLRAFKIFSQKAKQHRLVICGKRWENSNLIKLTKELGITNKIITLGHVEHNDLPGLYNLADFFVYPSLHETFGMPLIESMACGCPIITSNRYAMPEVVEKAALLINNPADEKELANLMFELHNDSELRQKLIACGLERAKKFTWEECAKKTLAVYEAVYNEK